MPATLELEPCPWLSDDVATGLVGTNVAVTRSSGNPANCHLQSEPRGWSGEVDVMEGLTLDAMVAGFGLPAPEPVARLGERAGWVSEGVWEGNDVGGRVLVEHEGNGLVVFLMPSSPQPDVRATCEALARAIVATM